MKLKLALAFCCVVSGAGTAPRAQQPDPVAVLVQKQFAELSGWISKSAEMVPADKYAYRPVATVRTFGEMVGHVADGYNYFCGRASGKAVEWSDAVATGKHDKAALLRHLKTATDACAAAYAGATPARAPQLLANTSHSSLHYGNLVTYMRMLGLVPPSS